MLEYVVRFVAGGIIVTAFAALGDLLRPKSFAGLFGAVPSVALVALAIAVVKNGTGYAAIESRSMMLGAIALGAYSLFVCQILLRTRIRALPATLLALGLWLLIAFGLLLLVPGEA